MSTEDDTIVLAAQCTTPCDEDAAREIQMQAIVSCQLPDVGCLYILPACKLGEPRTNQRVYDMTIVTKSKELRDVGSFCSDMPPSGLFAVDGRTVLILLRDSERVMATICAKDETWDHHQMIDFNEGEFPFVFDDIMHQMLPSLTRKTGLSKLRASGDFDFTIVCNDGNIPVHSLILSSQWRFFKAMKESRMEESQTKELTLDFPVKWIEALVAYLYEEMPPLEFEVAVGLLDVAQMYDLPQLLYEAMDRIKREYMDMDKAMMAFKQACITKNEAVRKYCAGKIKEFMVEPETPVSDDLLESYSQTQLVQLFRDLNKLQ